MLREVGIVGCDFQAIEEMVDHMTASLYNRARLFEGRLALNPGLNLTRVSFSCVQKHFLG